MVLVIDVGNTNSKFGMFQGDKLLCSWRVASQPVRTSDEYGVQTLEFLRYHGHGEQDVQGIIISSVRPAANYTLEHMCRTFFDLPPLFVGPGIKTGMKLLYENPRELGADRIVNSIAAYTLYGGPCIAIDFGTATTFNAVSGKGEFLGGAICPGLKIAADALFEGAAKLPRIELAFPKGVIGKTTVTCMQSGIVYGFVGQVEYILRKMTEEMDCGPVQVVATGGMSEFVLDETDVIDVQDPLLTLRGLKLLYDRNTS